MNCKGLKLLFILFAFISIALLQYGYGRGGGGGMEILYFDCQKNHSLFIKALTVFDIVPVLNKKTVYLGKFQADQKIQECQLSATDKVIAQINADSIHMKNNNVTISRNGKYVDSFTYENPEHSYSYIFTSGSDEIDYMESVQTDTRKTLTLKVDGNRQ